MSFHGRNRTEPAQTTLTSRCTFGTYQQKRRPVKVAAVIAHNLHPRGCRGIGQRHDETHRQTAQVYFRQPQIRAHDRAPVQS